MKKLVLGSYILISFGLLAHLTTESALFANAQKKILYSEDPCTHLLLDSCQSQQLSYEDSQEKNLKDPFPKQIEERDYSVQKTEVNKGHEPLEEIRKKIASAKELALKKRYKQASLILNEILAEDPSNLEARMTLANVLSWDGKFIEALMQINYVLYLAPSNLDAKFIKATILRWKKEFGTSTRLYKDILSVNPKNFYSQLGLAYVHVGRGNYSRVNQIARRMVPSSEAEKKEMALLKKYTIEGSAFDFIFYRYQDNQGLETKKYLGIATDWMCDAQISWIYRHVDAIEPTSDSSFVVRGKLDSGQVDALKFASDCLDIGGGIGYAKISESSRGNFVIGNIRANIYTDKGNFNIGSIYDVYAETAAALFFKIRTWTNFIGYVNTISEKVTIGGHYIYVKYSDANHSNGVDLFTQLKACDKTFQIFLIYSISYLNFASQPVSFFTPSIISGGHGYFDPKNALNNQVSLPSRFDKLESLYFSFTPYVGYLTYHLLGIHYNGIYYIGNGLIGYRFSPKFIAEAIGEAGVYDLRHLHYSYSTITGHLRLIF